MPAALLQPVEIAHQPLIVIDQLLPAYANAEILDRALAKAAVMGVGQHQFAPGFMDSKAGAEDLETMPRRRVKNYFALILLLEFFMIGVFTDVQSDGAMAVFTTREAAEEFARADPFVTEGVVQEWRVLEWRESLTP